MNLMEAAQFPVSKDEISTALAELATHQAIASRILQYVLDKFQTLEKRGYKVGVVKVNSHGFCTLHTWLGNCIVRKLKEDGSVISYLRDAEVVIDEKVPLGHIRVYPKKKDG
jgi:hypothetical protein